MTALEALAGSRLSQVIVDDDKTGNEILNKGQLARRVTLIPLNRVGSNYDPRALISSIRNSSRRIAAHCRALPLIAAHRRASPLIATHRLARTGQEQNMRKKVGEAQQLVGRANASLAVDLLAFSPEVKDAMLHVFCSTLVCEDKTSARTVCERLKVKTVTLDGDLFDPSGARPLPI